MSARGVLAAAVAALASTAVATVCALPAGSAEPTTHHLRGYASAELGDRNPDRPVSVTLWRADGAGGAVEVGTVSTSGHPSRDYDFTVADGTYYVYASTTGPTEPEWLTDAPNRSEAHPVVVDGADVYAPPVVLDLRATLSGRVVDATGTPRRGLWIKAYRSPGQQTGPESVVAADQTDGEGRFTVPTGRGDFRIEVTDTTPRGLADTWWPAAASYDAAGDVRVRADTTLDVTATRGATISGTVRSSDGRPVPHLRVGTGTSRGEVTSGTVTGPDGHYALVGLAPGAHTLQFGGAGEPSFVAQTRTVTLTQDQQWAGVDAILTALPTQTPAGTDVTGRVLDGSGNPLPNVGVQVFVDPDGDPPDPDAAAVSDLTDADGFFHLTNLDADHYAPPGTAYLLRLSQADWDDDVAYGYGIFADDADLEVRPTWYPDAVHASGATRLVVPSTPSRLGDVVLDQRSGAISGRVLDEHGVRPENWTEQVQAWDTSGVLVDESPVWADGSYRLRGLPAGDYQVRFNDLPYEQGQPDLVGPWWPDVPDRQQAQLVHVTAGARTTGIDRDRTLPFRDVTGTVRYPSGDPVAYTKVVAMVPGSPADAEAADYVRTDARGAFTLRLVPGRYDLSLDDGYWSQVEPVRYRAASFGTLTVPSLPAAAPAPALTVSPYPAVSGHLTDAQGHPAIADVWLLQPGSDIPTLVTESDATGAYHVGFPYSSGENFVLRFEDAAGHVEYYPGTPDRAQAVPVVLGPDTRRSGLDLRFGGPPPVTPTSTPTPTPTPTPTQTPTQTAAASTEPRASAVTATARGRGHRVTVRVSVSAAGAPVAGVVTVREGTRTLRTATASDGSLLVRLPRLRPGRHLLTVEYAGAPDVLPSATTVRVRVPRRQAS